MQKIPVGQTIAFAYRFLVTEIATIVGIAWLPAVLASAASYAARSYAVTNRALIDAGDPQAGGAYLMISLVSLIIMVFASSMVAVAITRQALGQRNSGIVFYFAAGRSEWRMLSANLLFFVGAGALFGLAIVVTLAAFLLAGVPLNAPDQIKPTAATILAGVISWTVFIYAFVTVLRIGFLLPATIVFEEKGGLKRSHDLAKGNVWRVLVIVLALGLPILLLLLGGEAVVLRSALGPDVAGVNATDFFQKAEAAMEDKMLPWTIFTTVVFILGSGLMYSGAAFAYRAAAGDGRSSPPVD